MLSPTNVVAAAAIVATCVASSNNAFAETNTRPSAPRLVEVRLGLSPSAADAFVEPRFRRLLTVELQGTATIASSATGPIHDSVAWVWVEMTAGSAAVLETRLGTQPVSRRSIALAGLGSDVSGRLVAVAVAEMIRAQVRAQRPRRAPVKPPPTENSEAANRLAPAVSWLPTLRSAWLPQTSSGLVGPSIEADVRVEHVGTRLVGGWYSGGVEGGRLGWWEVGIGLDYHSWLHPRWRASIGGLATAAIVNLSGVYAVDGIQGQTQSWSARGVAAARVETHLGGKCWLGLQLEPGAILRSVPYQPDVMGTHRIQGLWLGLSLSVRVEHRLR